MHIISNNIRTTGKKSNNQERKQKEKHERKQDINKGRATRQTKKQTSDLPKTKKIVTSQ